MEAQDAEDETDDGETTDARNGAEVAMSGNKDELHEGAEASEVEDDDKTPFQEVKNKRKMSPAQEINRSKDDCCPRRHGYHMCMHSYQD